MTAICRFLFSVSALLLTCRLYGQFYDSGEEPAFDSFQQINTTNFQIIFRPEFEAQAQRLAKTLEMVYLIESKNFSHKPRKISVLLHNRTITSNGYVAWAPRRIEYFTTPEPNDNSNDWLDMLAIHEFRHVLQIENLDQGITKIIGYIIGQQSAGMVSGLLPKWYLEGDAVYAETVYSASGRGRDASFEMEMKALLMNSDKLPSFEKILRGSYKTYIPDYYHFGYPMTKWIHSNIDSSAYSKIIDHVGQSPYQLVPFHLSLKKTTGFYDYQLYHKVFGQLKQKWNSEIDNQQKNQSKQISKTPNKDYINYLYPQVISDTSWLCIKTGMGLTTQLIELTASGNETIIETIGSVCPKNLSFANKKYVWAEEVPDIRWPNRSFSCIRVGNLTNRESHFLTSKSRVFSPVLSPDASRIAAVENNVSGQNSLIILDAQTGRETNRIDLPENTYLQNPSWSTTNLNQILAITVNRKSKDLVTIDVTNKTISVIYSTNNFNIGSPIDADSIIIFTADASNTSSIYTFRKSDHSIIKISNEPFGAFYPSYSANNQKITYSSYSASGYAISQLSSDTLKLEPLNATILENPKNNRINSIQNIQDSILPSANYTVTRYSKLSNLINIHSWMIPFYFDYLSLSSNDPQLLGGYMLMSQNKLATLISTIGGFYQDKQFHNIGTISYRGFFPTFDFSFQTDGDAVINRETNWQPNVKSQNIWTNTRMYIPLNFSQSRLYTYLTPYIDYQYQNEWYYNPNHKSYYQGMSYVDYGLNFQTYKPYSSRDLIPRLGFSAYALYSSTPFETLQIGDIWYIKSRIYLPGLVKHHSLQLTVGYQKQNIVRYILPNRISFPRGFSSHRSIELTTASIDYTFPIMYPDLHVGPILYLKRIRGNVWADYGQNYYNYYSSTLKKVMWTTDKLYSTGFDLTADFHLLRIIFPIYAGARFYYLPNASNNQFMIGPIFQVNFSSF